MELFPDVPWRVRSSQPGKLARKQLRIAADNEIPHAKSAPIVDRRNPPSGGLVFGSVPIVLFALCLKDGRLPVLHPDQVVGFVVVLNALVLVGDQEKRTVIPDVTEDMICLLLQIEGRRLFP